MISLRLKKPYRVRNPTFTLKLAFVLTVFLSNLKPACSSHHSDLSHNDRNLFPPSSLVVCEKLHQNHLTFYLQLLALSKIKPTRHKYFHIFLILLSGDVCLNPGPLKHPCSSCLKPMARTHKSLLCDECGLWAHIKCERISDKQYRKLMSTPDDKLFWSPAVLVLHKICPLPEKRSLTMKFLTMSMKFLLMTHMIVLRLSKM